MMKKFVVVSALFLFAVLMAAGCSAPSQEPAPPTLGQNENFFKDEGAHFELPNEFWYVTGKLDSQEGPFYFTVFFHKAGSAFIHSRNGYGSLRSPDGTYDYTSFGQGMIRTLAENKLKEKIEKFPDDERYPKILETLQADKSDHFYTMGEEERGLHRGSLYIDFGKNHFERTSKEKFLYKLRMDSWKGLLDLEMEATTDPLTFDAANPIKIGEKNMQGYFFPRVKVDGTIAADKGEMKLSGTAWYNHVFGNPDNKASARYEIITQRLDNGGAFVIANYYDSYNELKDSNLGFLNPDGTIERTLDVEIEAVKTWTGDVSRFTYPISWKIKGSEISGVVEPLFDNSEVMLEEGVGPFWLGPCTFKGKLGRSAFSGKIKGEGFCRVVGIEEKPKP